MTNSTAFNGSVVNASIASLGSTVTIGYCTGMNVEGDGSITVLGEPTGVGGYETVSVPTSDFESPVREGATQTMSRENTDDIPFPTATNDQGTFGFFIVRGANGSVAAVVPMQTPITVTVGVTPHVPAGGFSLSAS